MSIHDLLADERKSQQVKRIYDDHKFPFDVRYHLDKFLLTISWDGILKHASADQYASSFMQNLLKNIQESASNGSLSPLDKLNLQYSKNKIQEQFSHQPLQLIELMRDCFKEESFLRMSNQRNCDRETSEEDAELFQYKKMEEELRLVEEKLKENSQRVESMKEEFHTFLDEMVPKISDLNFSILEYHKKLEESSQNIREQDNCNIALQKLKEQIQCIALNITNHKEKLKTNVQEGCQYVKEALECSWRAIAKYKLQQKHSVCFLGKTPEGAADTLNVMCEISSNYLMLYIGYIEMVLADIKRVGFTPDPIKEHLDLVLNDMLSLLEKHLSSILVITKQPQNVIKIVQSKSPHINMSVTLLGASNLGIAHVLPRVTIRVYHEDKLPQAMEAGFPTIKGVCKTVDNGSDVQMVLKRPKNHMQANLNNIVLRGVERLEKKDKEDRVTEYKYGIVCYTSVTLRSIKYALKVLSLPVVLTSQTSQEGAAKGILIWDAAFSAQDRLLYEDPPQVLWAQMKEVIKGMFKETERELEDTQLDYIKTYVLGNAKPCDKQNSVLTKECFLRDKVRSCDFTYWMWIYACKNVIKECVFPEWKDRLIYGFIGRHEAEDALRDKEAGTFMLRFRERKLQDSQKANKCAYLAVAVVVCDRITGLKKVDHVKDFLTPADINKYGLVRILKAMTDSNTKESLLQTLYPDRNFQEIVQKHLPDSGYSSEGYRPTEFMIRVVNGNTGSEGSECPTSPLSTASALTPSPMAAASPHFTETDLHNNISDLLSFGNDTFPIKLDDLTTEVLLPGAESVLSAEWTPTNDSCIPIMVMDMQDDIGTADDELSPRPPKRRSSRSKSKGSKTLSE